MNWGQLFWVIYPYLVIAIFIVGIVARFNNDQYGWTSKSSEMLEKRILRWGSLLFHWGILFVFGGHVAGLLVPLSFYHAIGLPDESYHLMAITVGGVAGIATGVGAIILLCRRIGVRRIRATSSIGDMVAIVFLTLVIWTGITATGSNAAAHSGFDYRATIGPWIRGVLSLNPRPSLMVSVPWYFKVHIVSAFGLFATFPFTRLVHVFSLPITYLWRSYVVYRRRTPVRHHQSKHDTFR